VPDHFDVAISISIPILSETNYIGAPATPDCPRAGNSRRSRLPMSEWGRASVRVKPAGTLYGARYSRHQAANSGRVDRLAGDDPCVRDLAGSRIGHWPDYSFCSGYPILARLRRQGVLGPGATAPLYLGPGATAPQRATPYPATLRHARTRNHYLITDEGHTFENSYG
jgi:hypothetical protein